MIKNKKERKCKICGSIMIDTWFSNSEGKGMVDHKHIGPLEAVTFKSESLCKNCENALIEKLKLMSDEILDNIEKMSNNNHAFYIEMKKYILGFIK